MKTKEKFKQHGVRYSFYTVFFKRFLDILLSLLAIVILSPFLLLFALLTLIFNGYPIIYKQARPGRNKKIFYIYKFRSMNNKKDKDGNLLPDSQRITVWGKVIRKLSIDELPQFFNILKGQCSKNNYGIRINAYVILLFFNPIYFNINLCRFVFDSYLLD